MKLSCYSQRWSKELSFQFGSDHFSDEMGGIRMGAFFSAISRQQSASTSSNMPPRRKPSVEVIEDNEEPQVDFPTKLVGRILQETFKSPSTRISADALAVVAEY